MYSDEFSLKHAVFIGFHCFISGLLRHCTVLFFDSLFLCFLPHYTISSRFPLFLYRFVTSPCNLFKVSIVYLSVCYVTILSFQGFHCFIIGLLRHCSVLGLDCLFLCLLRQYTLSLRSSLFHYLFVTSLFYLFIVSIVLLSVCYVTALF